MIFFCLDIYILICYFVSLGFRQGSDFAEPARQGQGGMEVDPGSLGQMDVTYGAYSGGRGFETETFDEETPLLVELGINLQLIRLKVKCCVRYIVLSMWWHGLSSQFSIYC